MYRDPLAFLNLTDEETRRLQRIRIVAMSDRAKRESVKPAPYISVASDITDTDFLLDLLSKAIASRR